MSETVHSQELDYTKPIEAFALGTDHANFVVEAQKELPELGGYAYIFRHVPSSARVMWLACPDNNKSFCIGFKTPPTDSTGVFHILEHSVLCGSDKYPVKEPFINLAKTSMNTFLNAMTFPDKTIYPVASTNERDLENLMDVYLDAVLHPAIYNNRHIFEQEGWHYELSDDNKELTYNGVVFNEMKGAFSDPDAILFHAMNEALYPDTCYRHDSGGDPKKIVDLTYEQFLDNHKRHYSLANSYTIFYGNIDAERQLARLSEAFDTVEPTDEKPNTLELQEPCKPEITHVTMQNTPDNSCVGLGYVVGLSGQRERLLAIEILLDAILGSNEAPLKKKILRSGFGIDVASDIVTCLAQPAVLIELKGAKENVAQDFKDLVESTCARLAKRGVNKDQLRASLAQAEFVLREADFGYPKGVAYSVNCFNSWLYNDDDPTGALEYEAAIADLKQRVDTDYFDRLLEEIIVNCDHQACVDLQCSMDVHDSVLAKKLEKAYSTMDQSCFDEIHQNVAELREHQEAPDSPEDLAKLPQLALEDISDSAPEPEQKFIESAPLPCWWHNIDTNGIDYIYTYFWLDGILWEHLPYVSVMGDLLGKLDTNRYTAEELDTWIQANLGNLSFFCENYTNFYDIHDVRAAFCTGASVLSDKVEMAGRIIPEILLHTNFDDKERIRSILRQRKIAMEQVFMGSGNACAADRIRSYYRKGGLVNQKMTGIEYYRFICDMLENFDLRFPALHDTLVHIQHLIFVSNNCEVSFTGSRDDMEYFWDESGSLGLAASDNPIEKILEIPEPIAKSEAFKIPVNICFVASGRDANVEMTGDAGVYNVAQRVLTYEYLWNEVRIKGGAYGCGFRTFSNALMVNWSYRDPHLDQTVANFDGETEWLKNWNPTKEELTGFIVSTVAAHDAPVMPRAEGRRQDMARLCAQPEGWRLAVREQEITCTAEKIQNLAELLEQSKNTQSVCIFGNKDIIDASELRLKRLVLMEA